MLAHEGATVTVAYRWRWAALAALLIAEAMNLLDATIVQVAAPVIHTDLGGPRLRHPVVQRGLHAAVRGPADHRRPAGGHRRAAADVPDRRRRLRARLGGLRARRRAGLLIAARAVQGAAAALIIPQTIGLIRAMFDGAELAKALGSIGPVMGLAAVCGPVLGGVLTHADLFGSSWRSVFLVNVPLGVVVLPPCRLLRGGQGRRRGRASTSPAPCWRCSAPGCSSTRSSRATPPAGRAGPGPRWPPASPSWCVFGVHQRHRARRGRGPLVEPSLFAGRGFPGRAGQRSTLFFAVMNGLMVVIVLQLQLGLGATSSPPG